MKYSDSVSVLAYITSVIRHSYVLLNCYIIIICYSCNNGILLHIITVIMDYSNNGIIITHYYAAEGGKLHRQADSGNGT